MVTGDPLIPSKMGWVSKRGKFVGEGRWNGEGQREGAGVSLDVPHLRTMIREAHRVNEWKEARGDGHWGS